MGFFGALGKILAGKPVYGPSTESTPTPDHVPAPGARAVPVVRIGRIENRTSGPQLQVFADIHNESHEPIFLDRILLAGSHRELDTQLRPGESRQFLIYVGPLFTTPPRGYAEIHYRRQSDGDYFADYHEIRRHQEGAQGYFVTELLLRGPVKDI